MAERSADDAPTVDELIFLKADAPQQLYVGQTTPITLKLYISSSVKLRGLNAFERNADGFTISELPEESSEGVEMLNGSRYNVYSWPLTITPISTGLKLSIHSVRTNARPTKYPWLPIRRRHV